MREEPSNAPGCRTGDPRPALVTLQRVCEEARVPQGQQRWGPPEVRPRGRSAGAAARAARPHARVPSAAAGWQR